MRRVKGEEAREEGDDGGGCLAGVTEGAAVDVEECVIWLVQWGGVGGEVDCEGVEGGEGAVGVVEEGGCVEGWLGGRGRGGKGGGHLNMGWFGWWDEVS